MMAFESPKSLQERDEAAATKQIVDLIRSARDEPIKHEGSPITVGGEVIAHGNTFTTPFFVRITIMFLRGMFALHQDKSPWGIKRKNKRAINEVLEATRALQRSLDKLPDGLRYLACSNATPGLMSLKFRAKMAQEHSKALTRFQDFTVALKVIENRCVQMLREPPGERLNANYRNKQIAHCAADLLDYHGIQPTRGNDAKPSLFEQIASSLSEVVTGNRDVDLTYACRHVLEEEWRTQNYLRNDFNESEGKS
jgi:hypothetical protein